MSEEVGHGYTLEILVTRLEELIARVEGQEATIAEQRARITGLECRGAASEPRPPDSDAIPMAGRRDVLKRLLGTTAAVGAFSILQDANLAHADTRTTVLTGTGSTAAYGIIATVGGFDPATQLPSLGTTTHGIIGTSSASSPAPQFSSASMGCGSTFVGVQGLSTSSFGVLGQSTSHIGVAGTSGSAVGVYGQGSGSSGIGVYGTAPSGGFGVVGQGGSWAGVFSGGVFVTGALTVSGAKSAAVPHPDGSLRRLYCLESPESWFEDFGKAVLVDGAACVMLDSDFAAVVRSEDYHVFLTAGGDSQGLYVSSQTPESFEVREQQGGISCVPFSYRIVAKRKDIEGARFESVDPPDLTHAQQLKPLNVPTASELNRYDR